MPLFVLFGSSVTSLLRPLPLLHKSSASLSAPHCLAMPPFPELSYEKDGVATSAMSCRNTTSCRGCSLLLCRPSLTCMSCCNTGTCLWLLRTLKTVFSNCAMKTKLSCFALSCFICKCYHWMNKRRPQVLHFGH